MWRGGHRDAGVKTASDFYTSRNLVAVSRLRTRATAAPILVFAGRLQFAITALLNRASKLSRIAMSYYLHGGGGPVTSALLGTLYIPSFSVESHVGLLFERREKDLEVLAGYFVSLKALSCVTLKGSAAELGEIPDTSVDFIFTDPPFGSNIFYSDCSILWESWLGFYTACGG